MNYVDDASDFFIAGGALSAKAPSYVERCTDDELFQLALDGEYCYVLTPRQMGKSSLMVRTAHRLKHVGMKTAIIDLTKIGTEVTGEQWYLGILARLNSELRLRHDYHTWWEEHAHLGPIQRFTDYFPEIILAQIEEPIVIFIDEIDTTLRLGNFSDDFFAAVRSFYNFRAINPVFNQLSFVFLGVATPAELIKNPDRTPFNIGKEVQLNEFTRQEAKALEKGLATVSPSNYWALFDRIYDWTSGHPYLTQQLCLEVAEVGNKDWDINDIDIIVDQTFLADDAKNDKNIRFIKDRIQNHPRKPDLIRLYRNVYRGRNVTEDKRSIDQSLLQTFGLVKVKNGTLVISNKIYRNAFDNSWIRQNMDTNWSTIAAIAMGLLLLLLLGIYINDYLLLPDRAEKVELNFFAANSTPTRVAAVVDMYAIDPWIASRQRFKDKAIELFYKLNYWGEQESIFNKDEFPDADGLEHRIREVYITLADVDETNGSTFLLKAMSDNLLTMPDQSDGLSQLKEEIDAWLQARDSVQAGDLDSALNHLIFAVETNGRNPSTLFERGRIHTALGNYEQALDDFELVLIIDPEYIATPEPTVTVTQTSLTAGDSPSSGPMSTVSPTIERTGTPSMNEATLSALTPTTEAPVITTTPKPFRWIFLTRRDRVLAIEKFIERNPELAQLLAQSGPENYPNLLSEVQLIAPTTPTSIAPDPEVIFISYLVQPEDTLESIAEQLNSSIELMAKHGIGVKDIVPGAIINIPVYENPNILILPANAHLVHINAKVEYGPRIEELQELADNQRVALYDGDAVEISVGGKAQIEFGDGVRIELYHDPYLNEIRGQVVEDIPLSVQMFLLEGGLTGRMVGTGGTTTIQTPDDISITIIAGIPDAENESDWEIVRGSWNFTDDIVFAKGTIGFNKAYIREQNLGDLSYEATFRKTSNDDGPIGLMIRYDETDDTGYQLLVWPHGGYQFSAFIGEARRIMAEEDNSNIINPGSEWNTVRITAVGPKITIYINEGEVASFIDDTFASGKVGLVIHGGPEQTAEFQKPVLIER